MEKRFVVRYDQTLHSNFYLCRGCLTHIALIKDSILTHKRFGAVLLKHADNLVIEKPEDYVDIVCITVAFVNCAGCNMYLGWKCVDILDGPSALFQEGKIALYLHNLLFWDGKRVVEADIMKAAAKVLCSGDEDGYQVLITDTMKPVEKMLVSREMKVQEHH